MGAGMGTPPTSKKRQHSTSSPAPRLSNAAKAAENDEAEDGEDSDGVVELPRKRAKQERQDEYALPDQRKAVMKENDAVSLTCDFCKSLALGTDNDIPPCNRQIIDGWVFECTTCANHRLESGDLDHKCFRAKQHADLEVFKRYSDYHGVNFPRHVVCEGCKNNKKPRDGRCDVDPYLQLRCSCCMGSKNSESRLCLVKATTGDAADLGWGFDVARQMGPKPTLQRGRQRWFRRECDICKSRPDKDRAGCSWLDSRETGEPGDAREPCLQCRQDNMSCFDGGMLVGHPDNLEVPTEWSTRGDLGGGWVELRGDKDIVTRPQCRQCYAHKRHCRASAKHAEYACNWCWQTGMVCQDLRDDDKIYPLFDLSRVGIGNFCPFARCRRCEATGRNCDRQRPCDSCFFNREGDMCDTWRMGAPGTLNCLKRRINLGDKMMLRPGPLYYLSMGYGPAGVDDEKDGTQIEHYIGPPFARYAFKTVADRPGETLKQNKQVVVAEIQKMRAALAAHGAPPNGAPGGELHGLNVNDITVDQLRTWMTRRWPDWTRQCDRRNYENHKAFEIVSKGYVSSRYMEVCRTEAETNMLVEDELELDEGDEELQLAPAPAPAPDPAPAPAPVLDNPARGSRSGNGDAVAVVLNTAPNVANNFAPTSMLSRREKGWWNENPDLPMIPGDLFTRAVPLTLFDPGDCANFQLRRWAKLLSPSMAPSEQALIEKCWRNRKGTTEFGLFSIMYGSHVRHSPVNPVLRGISWSSDNVEFQNLPCIEQMHACSGLVSTVCQDAEHNKPHQAVCEPCGISSSRRLVEDGDGFTRLDIVAMRAYFCTSCHSRLIGGPRSLSEMYLLGAKSVWGCRFANNTTIDGIVSVNGREMGLYPFSYPVTGCTCGVNIFKSRLCQEDRVRYARHALFQAEKMRQWRSMHGEAGLCPGCLIHKSKERATASPSYKELFAAEKTSTEETVSWACLVCGGLVLDQPKRSTIIGGWFDWFPMMAVSDWGLDQNMLGF
ncbi:uncharacterized protein MAM_07942 [Metarhizium album ARSEF 1941]|uniref:Zn(2)-C6 fungal-type DNA-binding domain protein n=1 Tax=Metarhizium album (strain ARSEF 1941) TaxID=1081103 RepID=A0A0B2WMG6_METAS|nr:uncharacterized protein MAM_07942 [Metarhizium album ARSEF 1941]KHN94205.1 hypothetical protein MAM_07942 [Metarhizium album ARSEF 1941]